jgi:hypothetical protein
MVRLSLHALSVYGKKVTSALRASHVIFNEICSCPPGESCTVDITELPGRRFEALVVRPRSVSNAKDWEPAATSSGSYRQLFDKRATAQRIRDAVAAMVGAPLHEQAPTVPDDLNIVLVDTGILRRARKHISGCERCSPCAEIPFESLLDQVTGYDPSVTQYILVDGSATCPRCLRQLRETTLVEIQPQVDSEV